MRTVLVLDVEHQGLGYRAHTVAMLAAADVPAGIILAAAQDAVCAGIDARAEALRSLVATPGAGQAMEYQEVEAQARDALALAKAGPVDPAQFPMLAATVGLDVDPSTKAPATDVLGVARATLTARDAWAMAGAAIREARLRGKAAVRATSTVEAAQDAADAIAWPALS